jgi:hypothetical protein
MSATAAIYERRERDELGEHDEHETRVSGHQRLRSVKRCNFSIFLFAFYYAMEKVNMPKS